MIHAVVYYCYNAHPKAARHKSINAVDTFDAFRMKGFIIWFKAV